MLRPGTCTMTNTEPHREDKSPSPSTVTGLNPSTHTSRKMWMRHEDTCCFSVVGLDTQYSKQGITLKS
ncbi:unnamed protein product [Staurois parvus]|uniref:Uncharacterized protein n=1 Tax=Staurois parvus TaxID=386267 RepID=A0ABN9G3D1_9NEOB|nr:unnamed protein product [Staurois parvus]